MPENKYTWDSIVINPHDKKAESAIGSECYFDNNPGSVLGRANYGDTVNLLPLKEIEPDSSYPFIFDGIKGPVAFSCIVVKKEDTYEELSKKWVGDNNLKVGDYVRVTRKAGNGENGWGNVWVREMDNYIGKTLKVAAISFDKDVIVLQCNGFNYSFPYFVLEKVEEPKSEYVPFESPQEFIFAYSKAHNEAMPDTELMLSSFGMWLKCGEHYESVTYIHNKGITIDDVSINWKTLFDYYTFLNGTPCGRLVEDNNG